MRDILPTLARLRVVDANQEEQRCRMTSAAVSGSMVWS